MNQRPENTEGDHPEGVPTPALESMLSRLLTACVLVATAVSLIGAAMYLYHHGAEKPAYSAFVGQPAGLTQPGTIVGGAVRLDPASVIQLGLVCLIATPVIRVGFSLAVFMAKKDGLYVAITLLVLGALSYGLWGGVA